MSAFMVSQAHIHYLVSAAVRLANVGPLAWIWNVDREQGTYSRAVLPPGNSARKRAVGQMLWDENLKSVCHRYPDGLALPGPVTCGYEYDDTQPVRRVDPVAVLKALSAYEYQACEHPGWPTSEAKAFCRALRAEAIRCLPGYEEATWDVGKD